MSDEVREMLDSTNFQFKDVDEDGNEIEMTLSEAMESLNNTNWKLAKENVRLQNIIDKIRKLRNANTHVENIYYAEGVLLNEPYCDIENVDNEELLDILRGDE